MLHLLGLQPASGDAYASCGCVYCRTLGALPSQSQLRTQWLPPHGQAMGQREACSLSGLGHQPLFGQLPFAERPLPLMSFGGRAADTPVSGLVCLMLH